ncbi:MAG: MBL fold metallo-hydrolase [Clostridia bacterium]|nr:MBL fold metallo-hydrolase [Clostridia bacterium]
MEIKTIVVGSLETNCYIVSLPERNDCLVIDPGDEAEKIMAQTYGKEVSAVLLTHGHYDHTGAMDAFSCPVYIHPADEIMLKDAAWSAMGEGSPFQPRKGDLRFIMEGSRLHLAGMDIQVLHTPGHTPGCVCYQFDSALFTGDTLFRHGYGRTDLMGGNFSQLVMSLRRLYRLDPETPFYSGHGAPSTIAKERGH